MHLRDHSLAPSKGADERRARELRREREIGNWGRASEHIGRRWEELGFALLERMTSGNPSLGPWRSQSPHPLAVVPLMSDQGIQALLGRLGLPSPDVVVVLANGGGEPCLQSLDFKWDLEFASYDQVCSSALRMLLERDNGALAGALSPTAGDGIAGLSLVDGLFFAPDSPANRRYLASAANRRKEYPIETDEVVFAPVDPEAFFAVLPGWQMGIRLAEMDRAMPALRTLDGAERYYRLGAGLLGAVAQLRCSVFQAEPLVPEPVEAHAWLQARAKSPNTTGFVESVERLMAMRSQLSLRLRRLTRSPLRTVDLARALAARGVILPTDGDEANAPDRVRWMGIARRVAGEYRTAITRAGLKLAQGGLDDGEVLARLEADAGRFADAARTLANRLIDNSLRETPV